MIGRKRTAFTLIELLVVIAIIALLVSILTPTIGKAKALAQRVVCQSQMKSLAQAVYLYNNEYECFPALGYREQGHVSPEWFWYQKEGLGHFFGEDIPKYPSYKGISSPPAGSMIRCPSRARWSGIDPRQSWIGYNAEMCLPLAPPGTDHKCYWRGPKLDEITNPLDSLVLFEDARSVGFWYVCDYPYNDKDHPGPRVGDYSRSTYDARHMGGANYSFADGHAAGVSDPNTAFFAGQLHASATNPGR